MERKAREDNVGRFEGVDGADGCQVQFTSWMVEGIIGFLGDGRLIRTRTLILQTCMRRITVPRALPAGR